MPSFRGNLPDPGVEPTSPALTGGFFTTEPPGKPQMEETEGLKKHTHTKTWGEVSVYLQKYICICI